MKLDQRLARSKDCQFLCLRLLRYHCRKECDWARMCAYAHATCIQISYVILVPIRLTDRQRKRNKTRSTQRVFSNGCTTSCAKENEQTYLTRTNFKKKKIFFVPYTSARPFLYPFALFIAHTCFASKTCTKYTIFENENDPFSSLSFSLSIFFFFYYFVSNTQSFILQSFLLLSLFYFRFFFSCSFFLYIPSSFQSVLPNCWLVENEIYF